MKQKPANGSAPASAKARGAGTSHHTSEKATPHYAQAQGLHFPPSLANPEIPDLNVTREQVRFTRSAEGSVSGRAREPFGAENRQGAEISQSPIPGDRSLSGLNVAAGDCVANDLLTARRRKRAFAPKNHQAACDPWYGRVRDYLESAGGRKDLVTTPGILVDGLGLELAVLDPKGSEVQRVGRILHLLGWTKVRASDSKRTWQWARNAPAARAADWPRLIVRFLDEPAEEVMVKTSVAEILSACLHFDLDRIDPQGGEAQRVGQILRSLGWEKRQRGRGDKRPWIWTRPAAADAVDWALAIAGYLDDPAAGFRTEVTVRELLVECLGLEPAKMNPQGGEAQRVGQILRSLGWSKFQLSGGTRPWTWRRSRRELVAA